MPMLKTNQIAYWKTDENSGTAADAVGLGVYPLTNLNSVTYTTGKINNGAYMGTTKAHNKKLHRLDSMGVDLSGAWTVGGWLQGVGAWGSDTALDIVDWRSTNGTSRYVNMHWVPTGGRLSVDVSGTTINAFFNPWFFNLSKAININALLLPDAGGDLISKYCSPRF
jgi:hypothetical protein